MIVDYTLIFKVSIASFSMQIAVTQSAVSDLGQYAKKVNKKFSLVCLNVLCLLKLISLQ